MSSPPKGPPSAPGGEPPKRPTPGLTDEERAALGKPPGWDQGKTQAAREAAALKHLEQELDEVESYRMPLMEHLIELKDRLLRAFAALILGTCVGFYFAKEIYDWLTAPFILALSEVPGMDGSGLALVHSPFEGIYVWLKVSLVAGFMIASPVVSYQVWQFVAPGLYKSERNIVMPLTVSSVVLFTAGAGFCFYGIFPYAFPFFIEVLGVEVNLSADGYLSAVLRMMLAFGLCFQLPVVAFFTAVTGLVDARDMYEFFRYAVVVIFLVAALITPPDPMTQTMLAIPMIMLYVFSIGIAWVFSTKKRAEVAEV